jgi:hypothetical protein
MAGDADKKKKKGGKKAKKVAKKWAVWDSLNPTTAGAHTTGTNEWITQINNLTRHRPVRKASVLH